MNKFRLVLVLLAAAAAAQSQSQTIGVRTVVVAYQALTAAATAPATVAVPAPSRVDVVTHLAGWIERVAVASPYATVTAGEALCTIYSPELFAAEQDYLAARAYAAALAPSGEMGGEAGVAAGGARVLAAAAARLEQAQVPAAERARLETTGVAASRWTLRAPASGVVMSFTAVPQMRVAAGAALYQLAQLDPIWVYADVPENELTAAAAGTPVALSFDALPGRSFSGQVALIEPQVSTASRTVPVRIVVANPKHALLPGMSGTAQLRRAAGRHLALPAEAVFQTGTEAVAFVADGQGHFTPRTLHLGARYGDDYAVLSGVRAGERVAASAQFLLDADAQLSAGLGAYAPPPPGVGATAPSPPPAAGSWKLALTTAPAPPHKGANQVRVQLTGPPGADTSSATAQVTFFMPAMPAMGMGAMRETATLKSSGGGLYQGALQLGSAGVWQVTATATQSGRTLAELHTTERATP